MKAVRKIVKKVISRQNSDEEFQRHPSAGSHHSPSDGYYTSEEDPRDSFDYRTVGGAASKQGYLEKKSKGKRFGKKWKVYYFIIQSGRLRYFKEESGFLDEAPEKGEIYLANVETQRDRTEVGASGVNRFVLRVRDTWLNETYHLAFTSERQLEEWEKAIGEAAETADPPGRSSLQEVTQLSQSSKRGRRRSSLNNLIDLISPSKASPSPARNPVEKIDVSWLTILREGHFTVHLRKPTVHGEDSGSSSPLQRTASKAHEILDLKEFQKLMKDDSSSSRESERFYRRGKHSNSSQDIASQAEKNGGAEGANIQNRLALSLTSSTGEPSGLELVPDGTDAEGAYVYTWKTLDGTVLQERTRRLHADWKSGSASIIGNVEADSGCAEVLEEIMRIQVDSDMNIIISSFSPGSPRWNWIVEEADEDENAVWWSGGEDQEKHLSYTVSHGGFTVAGLDPHPLCVDVRLTGVREEDFLLLISCCAFTGIALGSLQRNPARSKPTSPIALKARERRPTKKADSDAVVPDQDKDSTVIVGLQAPFQLSQPFPSPTMAKPSISLAHCSDRS